MIRELGRGTDQMRSVSVTRNIYSQADSSVLFGLGRTQVLCAVSLQQGVPKFLRNKGVGWLTAEYAVLPTATQERVTRESSTGHRDGRAVEISRVIGRTLRSCVNLDTLGEWTIVVDCDVLCADGGTRVASINGAALALERAQEAWLVAGRIKQPFLVQKPAAVAIGVTREHALLVDPDYKEDVEIIADFNIIATQSGIIEVQGGAEKEPISWELFSALCNTARVALEPLFNQSEATEELTPAPAASKKAPATKHAPKTMSEEKFPLFSLKNRLANATSK
jgi:ribonuclease PH